MFQRIIQKMSFDYSDVDVVLASYNCSEHIKEQVESLLGQSASGWQLIISDDSSTDDTLKILKGLSDINRNIKLISQPTNLGVISNVNCLLDRSKSEYTLFCDQDDVWLPNNIELKFDKMLQMEKVYGKQTPILIHTDLRVVDQDLTLIAPSFWKYQNLDPYPTKLFSKLIIKNFVTGCSMMINKSLKDLIGKIPEEAIMHDWWIALIAVTQGQIASISSPTILYRQHGQNTVGAKQWGMRYLANKIVNAHRTNKVIDKVIIQAEKFRDVYRDRLNIDHLSVLNEFISIRSKSYFFRKYLLIKNGHYDAFKLSNLGFFIII